MCSCHSDAPLHHLGTKRLCVIMEYTNAIHQYHVVALHIVSASRQTSSHRNSDGPTKWVCDGLADGGSENYMNQVSHIPGNVRTLGNVFMVGVVGLLRVHLDCQTRVLNHAHLRISLDGPTHLVPVDISPRPLLHIQIDLNEWRRYYLTMRRGGVQSMKVKTST